MVDDEKDIHDILKAFFELQGFEVFEAVEGVEASKTVRKEPFDVVLADLRMSGLDGLGVLKLYRLSRSVRYAFLDVMPVMF